MPETLTIVVVLLFIRPQLFLFYFYIDYYHLFQFNVICWIYLFLSILFCFERKSARSDKVLLLSLPFSLVHKLLVTGCVSLSLLSQNHFHIFFFFLGSILQRVISLSLSLFVYLLQILVMIIVYRKRKGKRGRL